MASALGSSFVTGAFTLGGVVFASAVGLWVDWRRRKSEDRTRWDKERLLVYSEFLTEATSVERKIQTPDALLPLRQIGFRVKLVASSGVAGAVDELEGFLGELKYYIEEVGPDEEEVHEQGIDAQLQQALSKCLRIMTHELGVTPAPGVALASAKSKPWWRSWTLRGRRH